MCSVGCICSWYQLILLVLNIQRNPSPMDQVTESWSVPGGMTWTDTPGRFRIFGAGDGDDWSPNGKNAALPNVWPEKQHLREFQVGCGKRVCRRDDGSWNTSGRSAVRFGWWCVQHQGMNAPSGHHNGFQDDPCKSCTCVKSLGKHLCRQSTTEQPFFNLIETEKIHKRTCKTLDPEAVAYARAIFIYTWGMMQ